MGPPPGYDWNPRLLTRLNKLWDLAEDTSKFSKYDKPKMNLLAVISVINALRETKNGHVITEWTLRDQSGASLKMTLWGATGVAWTEHVKVGDVIYVKGEIEFRISIMSPFTDPWAD
jgi:DNA polymerase III alpha subunit